MTNDDVGGMIVEWPYSLTVRTTAFHAVDWSSILHRVIIFAGITQLVECQICNLNVVGANPTTGSPGWCNSSTELFESSCRGANPCPGIDIFQTFVYNMV